MGHAFKHLGDFQNIDPSLTEDDVAKILEYTRQNAKSGGGGTQTSFGGKLYKGNVDIGGKTVEVHVVETSSGNIKTGFPKI